MVWASRVGVSEIVAGSICLSALNTCQVIPAYDCTDECGEIEMFDACLLLCVCAHVGRVGRVVLRFGMLQRVGNLTRNDPASCFGNEFDLFPSSTGVFQLLYPPGGEWH